MVEFILTTLNAIASDNNNISRADYAIVMDYLHKKSLYIIEFCL